MEIQHQSLEKLAYTKLDQLREDTDDFRQYIIFISEDNETVKVNKSPQLSYVGKKSRKKLKNEGIKNYKKMGISFKKLQNEICEEKDEDLVNNIIFREYSFYSIKVCFIVLPPNIKCSFRI